MELLQECAEEWQIDRHKIAVIGFSAGGHLAAAMSTIYPRFFFRGHGYFGSFF